MATKKTKQPARPELVPGQLVKIIGGMHKGQAGQVRGRPDAKGAIPLLIGGRVRKVQPENIGGE